MMLGTRCEKSCRDKNMFGNFDGLRGKYVYTRYLVFLPGLKVHQMVPLVLSGI